MKESKCGNISVLQTPKKKKKLPATPAKAGVEATRSSKRQSERHNKIIRLSSDLQRSYFLYFIFKAKTLIFYTKNHLSFMILKIFKSDNQSILRYTSFIYVYHYKNSKMYVI